MLPSIHEQVFSVGKPAEGKIPLEVVQILAVLSISHTEEGQFLAYPLFRLLHGEDEVRNAGLLTFEQANLLFTTLRQLFGHQGERDVSNEERATLPMFTNLEAFRGVFIAPKGSSEEKETPFSAERVGKTYFLPRAIFNALIRLGFYHKPTGLIMAEKLAQTSELQLTGIRGFGKGARRQIVIDLLNTIQADYIARRIEQLKEYVPIL